MKIRRAFKYCFVLALIVWEALTGAEAQNLAGGLGPPGATGTVTSITCNGGLTGGTITASGTCALDVAHANIWTAAQSFTDGDLVLLGLTSGSSTIKAPATGGGTATLPAGSGTLVYAAGAVTSIAGTANQVNASASTGAVTLSLSSTLVAPGSAAFTGGKLTFGAALSANNPGTAGFNLVETPATFTDSGTTGTTALLYGHVLGGNTIAATNTKTYTNEVGTYFLNDVAGTGSTFTNRYALGADSFFMGGTTLTTNTSALNINATFNNAGVTFTCAFCFNLTDTASNASSAVLLMKVGAGTVLSIDKFGDTTSGNFNATGSAAFTFNFQTFWTSPSAGVWQSGQADVPAPIAQGLRAQGVAAGTSNTAGQNWTFSGSPGTGTGAGGSIIFRTAPAGTTGSAQNAEVTALTIASASLVALPAITSDATHTDSSVCQDTTTHALYFGSGTVGICLGTSSLRYKRNVAPLNVGLPQILALEPQSYYLKAGFGDTKKQYYGFIAERSEKVLPVLVGADKIGRANTFDYVGVIPVLVHAVQQQQLQIAQLKTQVAQLNSRMGKQQWEIDFLLKRLPKARH